MPASREQLISAVVVALAGLSATVERDADIPETVPPRGLVIVRSAAPEIDDETLGAVRSWYMRLDVPVEVYVVGGDAASRASRLDALLTDIGAALGSDAPLRALVANMQPTLSELEAIAGDGQTTLAAAQLTVQLEYDAPTPIG